MREEPKFNTDADLKILIADDHKMVAGAISDFLTKVGGFEVYCAHSLDETFDILNESPDVDIIMLDLKMPGMVGIASVKSVLDAAPESKVVIFSAYADTIILDRALQSGVRGFIPKSLTVKSLPSILRLVDSGQTFFPFNPKPQNTFSQNKDQLTEIEISIVRMIADGATNKHIANETGQTETTIKMVMRSICKKLGAKNRAHAAILGRSLVEVDS
jgi:two-component system nitrate/nitrite response regulator NarP